MARPKGLTDAPVARPIDVSSVAIFKRDSRVELCELTEAASPADSDHISDENAPRRRSWGFEKLRTAWAGAGVFGDF